MKGDERKAAIASYKERDDVAGIYQVRCAASGEIDDHGAESFAFAVLERLADEESSFVRDALLKERVAHWRSALGAQAI